MIQHYKIWYNTTALLLLLKLISLHTGQLEQTQIMWTWYLITIYHNFNMILLHICTTTVYHSYNYKYYYHFYYYYWTASANPDHLMEKHYFPSQYTSTRAASASATSTYHQQVSFVQKKFQTKSKELFLHHFVQSGAGAWKEGWSTMSTTWRQ